MSRLESSVKPQKMSRKILHRESPLFCPNLVEDESSNKSWNILIIFSCRPAHFENLQSFHISPYPSESLGGGVLTLKYVSYVFHTNKFISIHFAICFENDLENDTYMKSKMKLISFHDEMYPWLCKTFPTYYTTCSPSLCNRMIYSLPLTSMSPSDLL
jgi:hypothetical protein